MVSQAERHRDPWVSRHATYALPDDPIRLIGKAQTEDITSQLNDGIRAFDIRVKFNNGEDGCWTPAGTERLRRLLTGFSLPAR